MDDNLCRDIMKRILDLRDTDIVVYRELLKIKKARVKDISKIIGRDRTTIQRSLNRLVNAGLCYKEKKIIKNGGCFYVYHVRESEEIRSILESCLDKWYYKIKEKLRLKGEMLV